MRNIRLLAGILFFGILSFCLAINCGEEEGIVDSVDESVPAVSVARTDWFYSSKPAILGEDWRRAGLTWYNPLNLVPGSEVWDIEIFPGQGFVNVLNLEFDPSTIDRRIYVDSSAQIGDPTESWGGITGFIPEESIKPSKSHFILVRLKGDYGQLHIDIGQISEDINGNGLMDTEDANQNTSVEEEEDTGLDLMDNNQEQVYYNDMAPDPAGDDWGFDPDIAPLNYENINGMQGNRLDPAAVGRPDTENYNRDSVFSVINSYASYHIDLADDNDIYMVIDSENENGWKSYFIILDSEYLTEYPYGDIPIRLWLSSSSGETISLSIAQMEIRTLELF